MSTLGWDIQTSAITSPASTNLWGLEKKKTNISSSLPPLILAYSFFPEIWLARLRPWITSKTNKQTAWRNLWACFCPAFHLDNKNPSVLERGQASHRYIRQGNVVHLLICCKFTLNHTWSFNKAHLSQHHAEGETPNFNLKQKACLWLCLLLV